MFAVLPYRLDEVARVIPFRPLYQGGDDVAAQPLAITYDGIESFLAEVMDEINAEIDALQLFEECVDGGEQLFTLLGFGDDGVDHLVMSVYHLLELLFVTLIALQGKV